MLLLAAAREELGDLDGEVVGIGAVNAAARTATLLARLRPEAVLLVGTGAAYPGGPEVGTAVCAARVGLSYGVAVMGLGYLPRPPAPVACEPALTASLDLLHVPVLTVGAVTTDSVLAARQADGWDVEHMEAFGVALACAQQEVPFAAVIGIACHAGAHAHAHWLMNRDAAQRVAREAVLRLSTHA